MIERLKQVVHRGIRSDRFCECRHCGTTVDHPGVGCPTCDSGEIACYRI